MKLISCYVTFSPQTGLADALERNALVNAQGNASQAEMLVSQAVRASPRVQPLGRVDIARGYIAFSSCFYFILFFTNFSLFISLVL